ncbi:hypothetical protein ILYODFUR_008708 [Ilyodon furcidens]|uniref:Uncharacterized protein n=1 Tax=Ilyodon furcidens TaxID=33524 RepID=A0ABV0TT34_9TELE
MDDSVSTALHITSLCHTWKRVRMLFLSQCWVFHPFTILYHRNFEHFIHNILGQGLHGGAVDSTVALQQEGPGVDSWLGVFLHGYSGFLPQSKDMPVRLIGVSKLPLGV